MMDISPSNKVWVNSTFTLKNLIYVPKCSHALCLYLKIPREDLKVKDKVKYLLITLELHYWCFRENKVFLLNHWVRASCWSTFDKYYNHVKQKTSPSLPIVQIHCSTDASWVWWCPGFSPQYCKNKKEKKYWCQTIQNPLKLVKLRGVSAVTTPLLYWKELQKSSKVHRDSITFPPTPVDQLSPVTVLKSIGMWRRHGVGGKSSCRATCHGTRGGCV